MLAGHPHAVVSAESMTASGSVSVPRSPTWGHAVNSEEEITIAAAGDGLARLETAVADLPHGHSHAGDRRLGQLFILAVAIDRGLG